MSVSSLEYIRHIQDEIDYLMGQSRNLDKEAFMHNETLKRAFVRSIEIIGEASKKVSSELKKRYPDIEWKAIAGMRDKLVHDYFGVDHDIIWDVVRNKIPHLCKQMNNIQEQEKQV